MRLPYFTRSFLGNLKGSTVNNLRSYAGSDDWVEHFAGGSDWCRESGLVVGPPPILQEDGDDPQRCDAENAIRIYSWLEALQPVLAMEERLWAYLTHCTFRGYMLKRWPVDTREVTIRRYFLEGGSFSALSRNGIARLWWAAHLTKDLDRPDHFELTRTLFVRQDVQVGLLERAIGKCTNVRFGILNYLKLNPELEKRPAFGRRIQLMLRHLNLLGGVLVLDALPVATLMAHIVAIGTQVDAELAAQSIT